MPVEPKRVLKADSIRSLGSRVLFNYEDLQTRCEAHLERVRKEAEQILVQARIDAEKMRLETYEQIKQDARQEGLREAEVLIEKRAQAISEDVKTHQMQSLWPALNKVVEQLELERDRWLAEWEASAVEICVTIAEKIIGQELAKRPGQTCEMIRSALELVSGNRNITIQLHPDDVALLGDNAAQVIQSMARCGDVTIVADESITPGGSVLQTQHGSIDAQIETQLQRIAAELLESDV